MTDRPEPGLFNDYTFVVVCEGRYSHDELLFNRDGSVDFDREDDYGQGTVSMTLTFQQLERAYQIAKAMKEYYG